MEPSELTDKQTTRMVQLLRSVELFKAPDGSCLSPLGEYNLNLGIRKVLEPDVIATARDKASAYEGHPFIVEAAVSLGGKGVKEGITVVRFANRIPLLFEAGADVATRVAQSKIKWSSYKIDHKRDRIGVFVSIVSTKVPFKGTGKEYIGDDITEIQTSVKRALQSCCQQLRAHLTKRNALKDIKERKNRLVKYVPDICRSLYGLLDAMRKRKREPEDDVLPPQMRRIASSPSKRMRLDTKEQEKLIGKLNNGDITEATIQKNLMLTIEKQGATEEAANGNFASGKRKSEKQLRPVYLLPCYELTDPKDDLIHPLFVFRPMRPISIANQKKSYFSDESGSSSIERL